MFVMFVGLIVFLCQIQNQGVPAPWVGVVRRGSFNTLIHFCTDLRKFKRFKTSKSANKTVCEKKKKRKKTSPSVTRTSHTSLCGFCHPRTV
ncbi:hypothetical protein BCR43DRAFT_494895 [Syncephalastrum racemosum]|uniref:Secreted protein n=1 Tax=Syncephalastrum racemosum TaxID=13706 RepID=A0A1X2H8T9_SYNRA|nr:hypothetical protein BCR43DRAFT_494895 [Syncephalastrum racemosum]